jgi:acyl-CoA reductase-like NAD-dependent aldehyde dehydrogenase
MATERIVVDRAVADDFVGRFVKKANSLTVGNPHNGSFPIAACVDLSTVARVREMIDDATKKGAKLVAGGTGEGVFFPPTVLDHVRPGMRIYHEESFGPVVGIVRVADVDEAVRIANDTEYGLAAAVFGRDINRALSVAQRIESGICHINGPTVQDEAQMPFGGVKASGYGRFGGKAGVHEFTDLRWITIEMQPRHYPI